MDLGDRLLRQRERYKALWEQYKEVCAQEKDVTTAIAQLEEKQRALNTDGARLQGALSVLKEDIQELEKEAPTVVNAVGIPSE
jgi:chromosome segregation ATPase